MALHNWFRQIAMTRVIATALGKNAPTSIPTSGDRAKTNDFYVVYLLDKEGTARFLADDITETEVRGKWSLDGQNFTEPMTLSISKLSSFTVWIHHYYRG